MQGGGKIKSHLHLLIIAGDLIRKCILEASLFLIGKTPSLSSSASVQMGGSRWLRPEVYPLFAAVGVAVGICGFQLARNICINPEVRVAKQNRAAGILDNFSEGEKYAEHGLRKLVRNRPPEIMPSVNNFFTDPKLN